MATVKKCDACGAIYEIPSPLPKDYREHPNGIRLLCVKDFKEGLSYSNYPLMDICPACMDKILNVLNLKEKNDGD